MGRGKYESVDIVAVGLGVLLFAVMLALIEAIDRV
jgi:hypothetical protein